MVGALVELAGWGSRCDSRVSLVHECCVNTSIKFLCALKQS